MVWLTAAAIFLTALQVISGSSLFARAYLKHAARSSKAIRRRIDETWNSRVARRNRLLDLLIGGLAIFFALADIAVRVDSPIRLAYAFAIVAVLQAYDLWAVQARQGRLAARIRPPLVPVEIHGSALGSLIALVATVLLLLPQARTDAASAVFVASAEIVAVLAALSMHTMRQGLSATAPDVDVYIDDIARADLITTTAQGVAFCAAYFSLFQLLRGSANLVTIVSSGLAVVAFLISLTPFLRTAAGGMDLAASNHE